MKNVKELIVMLVQIVLFYVWPLFVSNPMEMVFSLIGLTFILALVLGWSKNKIKYIAPFVYAVAFIPSVFIFYNESALMHSIWYLVISFAGVVFSTLVCKLAEKVQKK